ncbi:MFS transporter [Orrella sp. NBD-18]|uniref:MFS transporter n=1 Tax=Sheuella amnicola TaxID=2707330 RepID=A0A6B2R237_9BURK|nr:MFS transporter [Sheuella amnicola]NDY84292.1 MFS transporter [Sheuella amnicola]HBI83323.1 MFS transporter [Alcaligenaceae bacterium]
MIHTASADEAYKKVTLRLIPFLFICYLAAYLDRVNVGFAKLQMLSDLKFSETVYGLGAGIFFIGYFIFEVPSNILLEKIGPRVWIARIMVTWGVLSSCMMFVSSEVTYYVLRFMLGVAEAGFFPGIILYLTYWYPQDRRGRIVALFMTAVAFSGVIGGPLSGWILDTFSGQYGIAGWQWLFLLEGLPSVVLGVITFFYLDDSIAKSKWLTSEEKTFLQARIDADVKEKVHLPVAKIFTDLRVLLFSGIYFFMVMGLYGVGFWLPNIIKNAGVTNVLHNGFLSAIPYFVAAVAMVLVGKSSDRTGERHWHLIISSVIGGTGFWLSGVYATDLTIALIGITIATAGVLSSISLSWTLPTAYLTGTAAAAGIAMVNSIGNLSGFVSPFIVGWIKDMTGSLSGGLDFLAASIVFSAILVYCTKAIKPVR